MIITIIRIIMIIIMINITSIMIIIALMIMIIMIFIMQDHHDHHGDRDDGHDHDDDHHRIMMIISMIIIMIITINITIMTKIIIMIIIIIIIMIIIDIIAIIRVPSRGFFWVLNTHQNHMDPHFFWPWVQWTLCIDLSQAESNFSYQYHEVPGPAEILTLHLDSTTPISGGMGVGMEWTMPSHWRLQQVSCAVLRTNSTNHSQRTIHFHKKVIIWENEKS